jgi:hypothetical protein
MTKKSGSKAKPAGKSKESGVSVAEHRKLANTYHAKARLHSAKAELMEAKNPPKNTTPRGVY